MTTKFVADHELDYSRNQFQFGPAQALTFDEAYRANQLPLLQPEDARVIPRLPGSDAYMGRYESSRMSIAAFFAPDLFDKSHTFQKMIRAVRASAIGGKVDWKMFTRRRDLLHATICGRIEQFVERQEVITRFAALRGIGPFSVSVKGLWAGNQFNRGRLYLPLYPELREGENSIHIVQQRFWSRLTNFYGIGLINLMIELDVRETADLERVVRMFVNTVLFETRVTKLSLLETNDDLVLSGRVLHHIEL